MVASYLQWFSGSSELVTLFTYLSTSLAQVRVAVRVGSISSVNSSMMIVGLLERYAVGKSHFLGVLS